jgi:hypothetical protein
LTSITFGGWNTNATITNVNTAFEDCPINGVIHTGSNYEDFQTKVAGSSLATWTITN